MSNVCSLGFDFYIFFFNYPYEMGKLAYCFGLFMRFFASVSNKHNDTNDRRTTLRIHLYII